ncbi:MAG: mandelate racemase/muconate lactonizing enzyme family protein [Dehalococcoidia bacterium]|nr:mandelate racemase/muconate lactonizing enzyme family protein [Dehalococcoidia bacterium]MSQ16211.1 mandelate racemase/muconate lactonizing enzyme family protein [Dehalococcoidia bacterium]
MKITRARTRVVRTPADNPLVVGIPQPGTRDFVTLELDTDDGIQGIGLTFFGGALTQALKRAVDDLAALIIGDDPMPVEAIAAKLRRAAASAGPGGIFTLALSAIDIALWDIKGKALNQSVSALLGGYRDRAPTYASGALMRPFNIEYLAEAGPRLVEMGFRQMKTQLGAEPSAAKAVERIQVLREAIGDDIDLMCDINQLWSVNQAIDIGSRLEPYHLFWLEDVVAHDDYQGLARVADALTTPIAAGEYVYGIAPFRHMVEHRSIDIVMVDLLRVGGITQFRKVAGMAEAFNLPVVSHLVPEIQVHTMCAIPNGLTVEYMPWSLRLFEETPVIKDGQILVPQKPGLGLQFSQDTFRQYEVD